MIKYYCNICGTVMSSGNFSFTGNFGEGRRGIRWEVRIKLPESCANYHICNDCTRKAIIAKENEDD